MTDREEGDQSALLFLFQTGTTPMTQGKKYVFSRQSKGATQKKKSLYLKNALKKRSHTPTQMGITATAHHRH
jgi:hypothetical protein